MVMKFMSVDKKNVRFELLLDVPDEIGISDSVTGDVIVLLSQQSTNQIGFCKSIVDLLNNFNQENEFLRSENNFLNMQINNIKYEFNERGIISNNEFLELIR